MSYHLGKYLSTPVFSLLFMLLKYPGIDLVPRYLCMKVWSFSGECFSNIKSRNVACGIQQIPALTSGSTCIN